ncbi:unnamed protein product [Rotaria socialis]|uniref:Uncharacterized protein n=1 Tax=Rotaria socialis TaxID=392032 RepID=A0A821BZM0_9BILA|nr:unnamed protein product [Rotaria socialis]
MLRNRPLENFYKLANTSFPDGDYSNGISLEKIRSFPTLDRIRTIELADQYKIYELSIVCRIYLEIVAIILIVICLYDDNQWQVDAFAVVLAWTTVLSYLRFVPIFGANVVLLEVIMLKFLWFLPVLAVLICSHSAVFYMLLQNQSVFSTITFAWFRSSLCRLRGFFLCCGVTMTILVNHFRIALAVGEIANLSIIARVRNATRRYELLFEYEIFRLQCLWSLAPVHRCHEYIEKTSNR